VAKNLLLGAVFNIAVIEPLSGKVFFDQQLRKGATKTVPVTQAAVDVWAAQYETLLVGLDALSARRQAVPIRNGWSRSSPVAIP
jgi:hypothetical protein